ncbi:Probable dipeptidase A [Seminavis robusta]|uniref:Probable dipeptidase A n=1 Tax=Seminavis robusta TaxID=568900 RepID=A0A9N8DKC0_9STRA|nr:Probable dipeptidase A [Seminavis robusta]|eukprot:Sro168_g074950.1 Probable dipeptidase A (581) ;mRNA; r:99059-100988
MSGGPLLLTLLLVLMATISNGCTDILVTPGASADGSSMIGYNADSVSLYGVLYHYPRTEGRGGPGELRQVFDWDSGVRFGEIPEVNSTYNVIGNSNEHGLVIGESTFGGVPELAGQKQIDALGAVLDYGSLIYITLQRAKTAVEAIHTINALLDAYGYASSGESFSISDKSGDVWMMELIGRGDTYKKLGAVWVAQKIPDGYVGAHANQARTTTFPRDDPQNCLFAEDVVDVAVHYGLYPSTADPLKFSFSDTYNPVQFTSARMSEARVWSMFSQIAEEGFQQQYLDYALGINITKRMPLFIKPRAKLSLIDVMQLMNSHYEGTKLDPAKDNGAGIFASPYRSRPLVWEYQGKHYHNERTLATPRTGWSFIAQLRPWMPAELSALVWFAADDSSTSPRVPVFGSNWQVAEPYVGKGTQDGVPAPLLKLDMTKAFWVQNMVSNFCYYRWQDAYPVVREKIDNLQRDLLKQVQTLDDQLLKIYKTKGAKEAVDFATQFSVRTANAVHQQWLEFYGELFVRFRDFHIITEKKDEPSCGCDAKEPGLVDAVKKRIIDETGDHYEIPSNGQILNKESLLRSVAVQ